jgi:hypothetical protein
MPGFPFKTIALAAALAVGTLAMAEPAQARSRAPAIIAGIALGAVAAGVLTHSRRDYHPRSYYYAPPRRTYYAPPVSYSYRPEPWTPEWYAYCADRYRSFDPRDGTFQPYHGPRRLCR